MTELWNTAVVTPMEELFRQSGALLPRVLAMLVVVAVGVVIAWLTGAIMARALRVARFDHFSERIGFSHALSKGGVRDTPSLLVAHVLYWLVVLVFLMLGLSALELKPVDRFLEEAFAYIPRVLVALVVLVVGALLGNFFGRAALIAAVNAQITQARLLARGVRLGVWVFALAMACEQLGIATSIIVAAFSVAFGGVVLALALAFGLGAKDAAKVFIEKRLKREPAPQDEDLSHL